MAEKQMIFLDIDGILPEVLYELADDKTTNISRIAGHGQRVKRAVTIFPSVTLCCQASMFTGVFPARHGIVGNLWFDRGVNPPVFRKYTDARTAAGNYGFALYGLPTIVLPERPGLQFANNDMSKNIQTVYEMMKPAGLTSWQLYNQYSRGADRWIKPTRMAMIIFAICHEEKLHNCKWDRATFRQILSAVRGGDLPNLFVIYLSGHDNNSHEHGPDTQIPYFRDYVDPLIGRLIEELEKKRPLEEYHFMITSDHGQAKVSRDPSKVVTVEMLSEIMAGVPGGGFKMFKDDVVRDGDTAVIAREAGAIQVHLMNRATNNWNDPPRWEEDLIPAAEAFEKQRSGAGGFVDIIMLRREMGAEYEVYEAGKLSSLEAFFAGKDDVYPDAVRRMKGVNCSRSADLIVLLDYSTGKYFGKGLKAGEHGNLHVADSLIPLIVNGPGIPDGEIESASLVDAVPTIGKILGFETPTAEGVSII